jgi:hypothetical protein
MAKDSSSPRAAGYVPVPVEDIPRDTAGLCQVDLYVYLPTPKKFVLFVPAGEKFSIARKAALDRHSVPVLFKMDGSAKSAAVEPAITGVPERSILDHPVMGRGTNQTLKQLYHQILLSNESDLPGGAIQLLADTASDIVKAVAPELEDIKNRMLQSVQHIWIMNDASAIIAISALFAAANGFDSKKSLGDIVNAALVMDLPLIGLGAELADTYLTNPALLKPEDREKYENHPMDAYRVARQSIRYFTDTAVQLILNHHELKNGRGWPRRIRTESIFELARVFSAAVSTYESMKKAHLLGGAPNLGEAIVQMLEPNVEPHARAHNQEIFLRVLETMGLDESLKPRRAA